MFKKLANDPYVFDRAIKKSYQSGSSIGVPTRKFIRGFVRGVVTFFVIAFFGTINFIRGFFSEESNA